jgi:hypothetical protein
VNLCHLDAQAARVIRLVAAAQQSWPAEASSCLLGDYINSTHTMPCSDVLRAEAAVDLDGITLRRRIERLRRMMTL